MGNKTRHMSEFLSPVPWSSSFSDDSSYVNIISVGTTRLMP